jgi:hypothetical protein
VLTGYFWQPPLPSHLPLVPQVDCGCTAHIPRVSGLPATTGMQRPGDDASAQLQHAPAQALSQHRPSTQKPDWHSLALPQS